MTAVQSLFNCAFILNSPSWFASCISGKITDYAETKTGCHSAYLRAQASERDWFWSHDLFETDKNLHSRHSPKFHLKIDPVYYNNWRYFMT